MKNFFLKVKIKVLTITKRWCTIVTVIGKVGEEMRNLFKENIPLIIFLFLSACILFAWCEHVARTNEEISNQRLYYKEGLR